MNYSLNEVRVPVVDDYRERLMNEQERLNAEQAVNRECE